MLRRGNTITAGLKNRTYNGTFNKSEASYETHECVRLRAWLHIWGGDLVSSSLAVHDTAQGASNLGHFWTYLVAFGCGFRPT